MQCLYSLEADSILWLLCLWGGKVSQSSLTPLTWTQPGSSDRLWQVPSQVRQMSRTRLTVHIVLVFIVSRHGRQICTCRSVHGLRPAVEALTALCKELLRCI